MMLNAAVHLVQNSQMLLKKAVVKKCGVLDGAVCCIHRVTADGLIIRNNDDGKGPAQMVLMWILLPGTDPELAY